MMYIVIWLNEFDYLGQKSFETMNEAEIFLRCAHVAGYIIRCEDTATVYDRT